MSCIVFSLDFGNRVGDCHVREIQLKRKVSFSRSGVSGMHGWNAAGLIEFVVIELAIIEDYDQFSDTKGITSQ